MKYQREVKIADTVYVIHMMRTTDGIKMVSRLGRMIGVPFATLLRSKKEGLDHVLPDALRELFARMDGESEIQLIKDLCQYATVSSEKVWSPEQDKVFDLTFQGKIGELFKLVGEIVNHNFSDFLNDLAKTAASAKSTVQVAESQSPNTSSGSSGVQ